MTSSVELQETSVLLQENDKAERRGGRPTGLSDASEDSSRDRAEPREPVLAPSLPEALPPRPPTGPRPLGRRRRLFLFLALGTLAATLAGIAAGLVMACWVGDCLAAPGVARSASQSSSLRGSTLLRPPSTSEPVSRIAFGSCTSYDSTTPQGVWTRGVLPYRPHAWIWLGDLAYTDEPAFDCHDLPNAPACSCKADFLKSPPYSCLAGDIDNARDKVASQLAQPGYRDLLEYMCPAAGVRDGVTPAGDDPASCPRHVLGVYDDHDAGWNNGNARLPLRHELKQIFLDALGTVPGSPRRSAIRGIEWRYRLNAGLSGKEVDVILLDERFYRDTLPCATRRDWCERDVLAKKSNYGRSDRAWCQDFVRTQSPSGDAGSCCRNDEIVASGCARKDSRARLGGEEAWKKLCDPSSPGFGTIGAAVARDGGLDALPGPDGPAIGSQKPKHAPRFGMLDPQARILRSGVCDPLGPSQRAWLERALAAATTSPLTLVASSSVLIGNPNRNNGPHGWDSLCSGDDWDCYPRAQRALLAALQRAPGKGCIVVLTGDYHQSDIKVIAAWKGGATDARYGSGSFSRPTYQLMASGLTNSTARPGSPCEGWRQDHANLRPGGRCAFVSRPAFGAVTIDWRERVASLELRDALHGEYPLQALQISLETCQVLGYDHRDA